MTPTAAKDLLSTDPQLSAKLRASSLEEILAWRAAQQAKLEAADALCAEHPNLATSSRYDASGKLHLGRSNYSKRALDLETEARLYRQAIEIANAARLLKQNNIAW